jgi:3-hydroxyisobutyrate dehydrogenase
MVEINVLYPLQTMTDAIAPHPSPSRPTVGVFGMGLMGVPMVERLWVCGYPVIAGNRTAAKLEPLRSRSIPVFTKAAEVIAACDVMLTMVSDAAALHAVLGVEAVHAVLPGKTVIQMGTIAPQESQELAVMIQAAGGDYLESPVLGSIPQVRDGSLLLMVGATAAQFAQWRSLLTVFGPEPVHVGAVGTGAALKLAMNQLIGSLTAGFAASLGLVQREGIAVETFMDILRQSALYAPTFDKKLQRMCDRDFANPNFPTKHLGKDLRLFAQAAEAVGVNASVVAAIAQVTDLAADAGWADADYSAIAAAIDPPDAP